MISDEEDRELRRQARKIAEEKVGFWTHLVVYVCVNALLWSIWYFTDPNVFPWPIFVTFGWGIGLGANAVSAYGMTRRQFDLEEREYQRLKERKGRY